MDAIDRILDGLNTAQRAAVSSEASVLQVLAPPGSGKTKTLTSRVAYLLTHQRLKPWNIIVATFTTKAAREMKERLASQLANGLETKLILGTFHSICRRYLLRYGHLIGVNRAFGIADSADSLAIIKRIIKRHSFSAEDLNAYAARSRISRIKSSGNNEPLNAIEAMQDRKFKIVQKEYEDALTSTNQLDYDDLLLRCVQLLTHHPKCVSNIEAVLVDEFQDTNRVQFDLMHLFASAKNSITTVGDPDQSIYGFRSADSANLRRFSEHYPHSVVINLEENYRSSASILSAAQEVIEQDVERPAKSLVPTHCVGTLPVYLNTTHAYEEAQWIVSEILRSTKMTGNLLTYNDIAILLRSASLSRHVEAELTNKKISYRMAGGHRFFDRVEVKLILDYLRVISQPNNNEALARVINTPLRGIGDASVKALLEEAETKNTSMWKILNNGAPHNPTLHSKISKPAVRKFIDLIARARNSMLGKDSDLVIESRGRDAPLGLVDLIEYILGASKFKDYLDKKYPADSASRWANINELISQSSEFYNSYSSSAELRDEDDLPEVAGVEQEEKASVLAECVSTYLANVALVSETQQDEGPQTQQITISTIHSAKGLEWPVVFIVGVNDGSIPHVRAESVDEERRLLYVAMTRAKALLYMSYPDHDSQGGRWGEEPSRNDPSSFLDKKNVIRLLQEDVPEFTYPTIQSIATILRRPCPDQNAIPKDEDDHSDIEAYSAIVSKRKAPPHTYDNACYPKRARVNTTHAATVPPTTMQTSSSFSTSNTSLNHLNTGFITANSHLQDLRSQHQHTCVADADRARQRLEHAESLKQKQAAKKINKKPQQAKKPTPQFKFPVMDFPPEVLEPSLSGKAKAGSKPKGNTGALGKWLDQGMNGTIRPSSPRRQGLAELSDINSLAR